MITRMRMILLFLDDISVVVEEKSANSFINEQRKEERDKTKQNKTIP